MATKPAATQPVAGVQDIARVRDILLGPQMREYDQRFQLLQRDVERLQKLIDQLTGELHEQADSQARSLDSQVERLNGQLAQQDQRVAGKMAEETARVNGRFDELASRLEQQGAAQSLKLSQEGIARQRRGLAPRAARDGRETDARQDGPPVSGPNVGRDRRPIDQRRQRGQPGRSADRPAVPRRVESHR